MSDGWIATTMFCAATCLLALSCGSAYLSTMTPIIMALWCGTVSGLLLAAAVFLVITGFVVILTK